jgi:hypothetical protein
MMAEDIVSKSKRATVRFCDGVSVDGYEMPDGSFRVGITTASLVAGYAENYLRRQLGGTRSKALQSKGLEAVSSESGTRSKALQDIGFSGQTQKDARVTLAGEQREERTISTKDFLRFLRYADRAGKPEAGAIIDALAEQSLDGFFRDAFELSPLSTEENRKQFQVTYEESRARFYKECAAKTDFQLEDKEEALALVPWR